VNQALLMVDNLEAQSFVTVEIYERRTLALLFTTSATATCESLLRIFVLNYSLLPNNTDQGFYAFKDALPDTVKEWDLVARVSDCVPKSVLIEG
jgi:hypothetical protein